MNAYQLQRFDKQRDSHTMKCFYVMRIISGVGDRSEVKTLVWGSCQNYRSNPNIACGSSALGVVAFEQSQVWPRPLPGGSYPHLLKWRTTDSIFTSPKDSQSMTGSEEPLIHKVSDQQCMSSCEGHFGKKEILGTGSREIVVQGCRGDNFSHLDM